jgi:hypothetical protein
MDCFWWEREANHHKASLEQEQEVGDTFYGIGSGESLWNDKQQPCSADASPVQRLRGECYFAPAKCPHSPKRGVAARISNKQACCGGLRRRFHAWHQPQRARIAVLSAPKRVPSNFNSGCWCAGALLARARDGAKIALGRAKSFVV